METKINKILVNQILKSNTLFTVIRVKENDDYDHCFLKDTRYYKIGRWLRENCAYSYGISKVERTYEWNGGHVRNRKYFFYVAFSSEQDLLVSRFVLDNINPSPMWGTNTRFKVFILEE